MSLIQFINSQGFNTVSDSQRKMETEWLQWYQGFVKEFHSYNVWNGKKYIGMQRFYLGMAKYISEDWANLLLNEKVKIAAGTQMDKVLESVFEQNNFLVKANQLIEQAFALGTGAFVEYLSNDQVVIDYARADMIYPLSWENGYISECAFASERTVDEKSMYYVQMHMLENGYYLIKNFMVDKDSGKELDLPDNIAPIIYTGSTEPLFQIVTPNITNNLDLDSPLGMSIYGNALPQLKGCDLVYDSYINEFMLGKKRIMVQESASQSMLDESGIKHPIFDSNDVAYTVYTGESGTDPIKEINMTLRINEHDMAMQKALDLLSLKCGMGSDRYKFDGSGIKTATEIFEGKSDLQQSVSKHSLVIKSALTGLVRSIGFLSNTNVVDLKITLDDSVFRSPQAERKQDTADVAMGIMSHAEYRSKWYGETIEQAEKNLPVQEDGQIGGGGE